MPGLSSAEPNLGVLMFIAYRSLEERVYDAVVAAGGDDITMAQARMLARIGPNGTRTVDLAAQARVTKQTAGFLIEQLEAAGYVKRVPDPSDGRARLVRLAPKARRLLPFAEAEVERAFAEWTTHIGTSRMQALTEALTMLRDITDPYR